MPASPSTAPAPSPAAALDAPPAWLRFLALASAAGVLAFGAVGLLLAINDQYRPALAFPIGALVWAAVLVLARPAFGSRAPASRRAHTYAAIGVAAILAITAWNAMHTSQHVHLNRDGGSYTNTGRWIAREGTLDVHARVGPFATEPTIGFDSPAVYEMPGGVLQFQFAHFLPAVLAEAYSIKGDTGLFHAAEVLGGIALLAFFVLAWRLVRRPFFALTATLALAFLLPQVWYSRDTYSEIPSQILLFTALWLLADRRVLGRWRLALASGLFLGTLEAVRIDAIVFLIGVPVVFAIAWLRAREEPWRRDVLRSIVAFAVGLLPGFLLGLDDLARHSGHYFSDLSHDVRLLTIGAGASAVACAVAVVVWPWIAPAVRGLRRLAIATGAGAAVVVVGFLAWFVRPRVQHIHGKPIELVRGLQVAHHLTVDPTRTYFEHSFDWMSWYLGPLTLGVAIVAAGLLVRELVRGRMSRTVAVAAVLVPGSALYLYKASAVPDHVWVTRRYLVSAFPMFVLLAFGLAAACAAVDGAVRQSLRTALRVGAALFAVVAVAYPVSTIVHIRAMSEQRGFANVINIACADIGDHAAVVVLQRDPSDAFDDVVPQALRGWCGAEVGIMRRAPDAEALRSLARKWQAEGRTLWVASGAAGDLLQKLFPGTPVILTPEAVNERALEQTLTRRPATYMREGFAMAVARVPTG